MTNQNEIKEGWGFPGNSRKAHYFVDGTALCRKWGFYDGGLEQGNDDSPDNCAACMKALPKHRIAQQKGGNAEMALVKLDIDGLYEESEKAGRIGECPLCEFDGDTSEKVLCWCGVCFKYHHDDYFHEPVDPDPMLP